MNKKIINGFAILLIAFLLTACGSVGKKGSFTAEGNKQPSFDSYASSKTPAAVRAYERIKRSDK